ncbi:gentisate 1,2-dioxygenase [Paraburkholderia sp. MPAMCS5]|uniref:gentisate 1,2-dioxygenase n=1 Tax=Paraburkholderia sp. MPAMCS5 TaxID=3112563 RepID=UPI002E18476B|nr:gentisate 1,2-dioxygenase [Paraburkholderia sp. MPAMCS5]
MIHETTPERQAFYGVLDSHDLAPLWEAMATLVTPQPQSACVAASWQYERLRPLLLEAGALITAQEAERRVLVLENPGIRGRSQITNSLYAGLQLILPGEVAPAHRHAAAALRFIVEGEGAYTAVDGERVMMHPGDFVITPSWTWHDHGNLGSEPVVWLDGLDVPIVNLFDTSFAERSATKSQSVECAEDVAASRYGSNMLPLDYEVHGGNSPLFAYRYAPSRAALERLARSGQIDPVHGTKLQYANPATGGYPMPTIGAFLQLLPAGFNGAIYRSTDATVFNVVEGGGFSMIGEERFDWRPRDVFVVPSWIPVSHHANSESVLFSFSDRPAQKALGLWREHA